MEFFNRDRYIVEDINIVNKQIYAGDNVGIRDVFKIGIRWDWEPNYQLVTFAFLLNKDGKLVSDKHLVWQDSDLRLKVEHPGVDTTLASPIEILPTKVFKEVNIESRPTDPEMSVIGGIQYRTGAIPFELKPDNESWDIDLSKVHPSVEQIIFCASLYHGNNNEPMEDFLTFVRFHYPDQKGIDTEYLYLPRGYGMCSTVEIFALTKGPNGWQITPKRIGHQNIDELFTK